MKREYLLTGGEMASCDARTSNMIGIPSLVLMERAALSVADGVDVFLCGKFSPGRYGRRPLVLAAAGRGNNGADALAAGRILLDRGYEVVNRMNLPTLFLFLLLRQGGRGIHPLWKPSEERRRFRM